MAVGDSYYISHDIDAFDDIKIIALCDEFGLEAYALYWIILEKMFPEESISLPYSDMTFRALKAKSKASCDIKSLIDRAIEYELFVLEDGQFYSPSFVKRMEKHLDRKAKRSKAGRKGGQASAKARQQKKVENEEKKGSNDERLLNQALTKPQPNVNQTSTKPQPNLNQNQPNEMKRNEIEMKRNEIEMKRNEISLETSKDVSCTERSNDHSMPEPETFIELPLNDKTMHRVTVEDVDKYEALYPAVDIKQELRNMFGWLDSNPKRLKTRGGIKRFITNWLSKEQDKGGTRNRAPTYRSDRDNRGNFSTSFDDYEYDDGALTRVTMPRIEGSP
jgi:hypothetical protein